MGSFDDDAPPRPAPPKPRPVSPKSPAPPPPSAAVAAGGISEQKLAQLHKVYIEAKRRTGEQSNLTLDALRAQVAKQVPVIQAKHGCEKVDFKVVLKDGKAMLKAIPK